MHVLADVARDRGRSRFMSLLVARERGPPNAAGPLGDRTPCGSRSGTRLNPANG
jgi:hypothetical protein